ncbi:MAG: HEAT repeat domain-containing protein [Polyangiales bacterium]
MNSNDVEVRRDAVLAAGALREPDLSGLLMQALGDSDWRVREEAIHLVCDVAVEFGLLKPLITGLCQGNNVGLRNAARDVLRRLGGAAAPSLVSSLTEVEPNDRKFIVEALACGGTEEAIDTLIDSVRGHDPVIAVAAMDALAQLGGLRVEAALREKLRVGDTFEQAAALDALEHLAAAVQYDDLEPLLDDRLLRRIALDALGRSGDVRAVPHLLAALSDRSSHVTRRALLGLYRLQATNVDARKLLAAELPAHSLAVASLKTWVHDEDRSLGLAAATLLARARSTDTVQIAVELVSRDVAANQLAPAFDDWVEEALHAVLKVAADDAGWRAPALELACELGERAHERPAGVEKLRVALRDAFSDLETTVRIAVLRGLGRFGQANDAALLLGCTRDADVDIAVAAGNALRDLAFREPGAVRHVLANAMPSGPAGLAVAELLVDLGARDALDRLRQALWADEPSTRVYAIAGLARFGGQPAAELVALALRDETVEVQVAALEALTVMRDRGDTGNDAILQFESHDNDAMCAFTRALAMISEPRATQRLRGVAKTGSRDARLLALRTLVAAQDPGLDALLVEAASDADPEIAKEAIAELGGAARPHAAQHIARALAHPAAEVRRLAASWLARIGDRPSAQSLLVQLQGEQDPQVRNVLVEALEALREVR